MSQTKSARIQDHFAELTDPRRREVTYPLIDVTFQEDQCRIRKGHADANFSILRRTALSMLKNESTLKVGLKNNRLTAGWDETCLEKVLELVQLLFREFAGLM